MLVHDHVGLVTCSVDHLLLVLLVILLRILDLLLLERSWHWPLVPLVYLSISDEVLPLWHELHVSWHLKSAVLNDFGHPLHLRLHLLSFGGLLLAEQLTGHIGPLDRLGRFHALKRIAVDAEVIVWVHYRVCSILCPIQSAVSRVKEVMIRSHHEEHGLQPPHIGLFSAKFIDEYLSRRIRVEGLQYFHQLCLNSGPAGRLWYRDRPDGIYLRHEHLVRGYLVHEGAGHDVALDVGDEELLAQEPFVEVFPCGQVLVDLLSDTWLPWLLIEHVLIG